MVIPITLVTLVFTFALTFATLELPVILGRWLAGYFPDIHPYIEPDRIAQFMQTARPVGYLCLGIIAVLITGGFLTRKRSLSIIGSVALFLPTFGYFFASMFFLAGLGIIRVPFIPFWDPAVNIMKFGDIFYLPYMAVVYPLWHLGIDARDALAFSAIALGLVIFVSGTVAWFYGRIQNKKTVDFWIYRYSRHPQYLGFIVWSYGVMLLAGLEPVVRGGQNPGASLTWMLTSLVIVSIALHEEISMEKNDPAKYRQYEQSAPMLIAIPGFVSRVVTFPLRMIIRKDRPETGREIAVSFMIYTFIFVLLSLPFVLLDWPTGIGWSAWPTGSLG